MTKSHEIPTRGSMVFHASDGCDVRHETEGTLQACEDKATDAPKSSALPGSPLNLRLDPSGSLGRAAAKREKEAAQEPKITIIDDETGEPPEGRRSEMTTGPDCDAGSFEAQLQALLRKLDPDCRRWSDRVDIALDRIIQSELTMACPDCGTTGPAHRGGCPGTGD